MIFFLFPYGKIKLKPLLFKWIHIHTENLDRYPETQRIRIQYGSRFETLDNTTIYFYQNCGPRSFNNPDPDLDQVLSLFIAITKGYSINVVLT
jgi:hypothetical protein